VIQHDQPQAIKETIVPIIDQDHPTIQGHVVQEDVRHQDQLGPDVVQDNQAQQQIHIQVQDIQDHKVSLSPDSSD